MKQFERIQKEIQNMDSGMSMAGFIHGLEAASVAWCGKNDPDNIFINPGGMAEPTIYGLAEYLDSEVE